MRTLVAAAALLVLPVVPARAGTNTVTVAYVLERKPGHHGLLEITGDLDTDGGYAFAAGVRATLAGDGRYYDVTPWFFGGATGDNARGQHQDVPFGAGVAGDTLSNRIFLVLHGHLRSFTLAGTDSGWRARRWSGAVHIVNGPDAVSQSAAGYHVAYFDGSVTAPGGRRGSFAFVHPPCAARAGWGSLWLRGGQRDIETGCTYVGEVSPFAVYAPGRTTWKAEGIAYGWADIPTRLLVIDL